MSPATKPREADVARWVATCAEPEPSYWKNISRWETWKRSRDSAMDNLAAWGLRSDGQPKVTT